MSGDNRELDLRCYAVRAQSAQVTALVLYGWAVHELLIEHCGSRRRDGSAGADAISFQAPQPCRGEEHRHSVVYHFVTRILIHRDVSFSL